MPPSSGGGKEPSQITIGIKRALGGRITDRWLGSPGGARRGPFIGFFASAFKIAFFLGSLALLFVVIYFLLFNRELALGLLKGAGEKTFVWIQTVSPGFAEQLRTAYNLYFNPEEELARERGDEIKAVREKSGIEITDAGADRKSYAGNEPVNVNYIFVGKNLAEDIKLKGTCELDTGGKEKYIVDADFGDSAELSGGVKEQTGYGSCYFPEGASYSSGDMVKSINMHVIYPAYAKSSWKAYYIDAKFNKDNPREGINDNDLKSDGSMKTIPEKETAMLIGFVSGPQPYNQDRKNRLTLVMEKGRGVDGDLLKMNALKLEMPARFSLVEDERCDFESLENDEGERVYGVKKEVLDNRNIDCGEDDRCQLNKNQMSFSCGFVVTDVSGAQEHAEYGLFTAVAEYDFKMVRRTTIDVVREASDKIA